MNFADMPDSIRERAKACKSPEELLALAKEEGYELSDEDLDAVNGGDSWEDMRLDRDECTHLCNNLCNRLYK